MQNYKRIHFCTRYFIRYITKKASFLIYINDCVRTQRVYDTKEADPPESASLISSSVFVVTGPGVMFIL